MASSAFDRLSSVSFRTPTMRRTAAASALRDPQKGIAVNYRLYEFAEQRYCPARL